MDEPRCEKIRHSKGWSISPTTIKSAVSNFPLLVHNIVQKIGYPTKSPDIRNASLLEDYYQTVNISNVAYFDNALSIAHSDTLREWSALGKPTDRDEWGMTAPTVNVRSLARNQRSTTDATTFAQRLYDDELRLK